MLSMKLSYRLISVLLLSLPLVSVTLVWDQLPARIPMHFNSDRQPDRFGSRQEWMGMLLGILFLSSIIRAVVLRIAGSQRNIQPAQGRILYLLTAGFVAVTLALHILQGLYQSPVYADWLPALFFLSGATFNYLAFPQPEPKQEKESAFPNARLTKRLSTLQHMNQLSRLVVFRANLVAVLLMVFANHGDRWSIGIWANVLAYAFLLILTAVMNRNPV